jgi:ribosome-associated protein
MKPKKPKTKTQKRPSPKGRARPTRPVRGKSVRQTQRRRVAPEPLRPAENPRAKALAKKVAELVLDKKALDVVILDVRGMTSYADYFVIGSGESERQVAAMAENVVVRIKEEGGGSPLGSEGFETGRWVLLDYGEVVAHLFFEEVRGFYDLEGLWADAARERVA